MFTIYYYLTIFIREGFGNIDVLQYTFHPLSKAKSKQYLHVSVHLYIFEERGHKMSSVKGLNLRQGTMNISHTRLVY